LRYVYGGSKFLEIKEFLRVMKTLFLLFILGFSVAVYAGVDQDLAKQMAKNPDGKFHVLAFFEKQTPEQLIQEWNIRGDEFNTTMQVVELYKSRSQESFFWLNQLASQRMEIQSLQLHELLQAASFIASPAVIQEISQRPEICKVALYTEENAKPDEFFLKPEYYQVRSMNIIRLGDETENALDMAADSSREGEIDIDQIINILKKLYEFVKENKPVVNTSIDQSAAVPSGINSWQQLAGWREKHSGQYVISYENLYGIEVVRIVVRAHFYHSGNYQGVGKYITCATASIDELNVLWGYTLNATMKIPDSGIVNIGTSQNPVAGMKMFVHWVVTTILQHQEGSLTFSLDGNGNLSAY